MFDRFLEKVTGNLPLMLILLGLIALILVAIGSLPFGATPIQITSNLWRTVIGVIGVVLIIAGLTFIWPLLKDELPTSITPGKEYQYGGQIQDLYLLENNKISTMPAKRVWEYELSNIVLKKSSKKLSLTYDVAIRTGKKKRSIHYISRGTGSFVEGIAYLEYSFSPKDKTNASCWNGIMILQIPRGDKIHGVWVTTNISGDRKFAIGSIELAQTD